MMLAERDLLRKTLKTTDGWGDFLSGSGEDFHPFFVFLSRFYGGSGTNQTIIEDGDQTQLMVRGEILDLSETILKEQYSRFSFLRAIDPKWLVHPRLTVFFSSNEHLNPTRLAELALAAKEFKPVITSGDVGDISSWTSVLLIKELAQLIDLEENSGEKGEVALGLMGELLTRNIFLLSQGNGRTLVRATFMGRIPGSEETWVVEPRPEGTLGIYPVLNSKRRPKRLEIGRCYFTIINLSSGLTAARKRNSPEVALGMNEIKVARIIYDQYEPSSRFQISVLIKEYDDETLSPKVKCEVRFKERKKTSYDNGSI